MNSNFDLSKRPFAVIWETTRSEESGCAAVEAQQPVPELTTHEGQKLIREAAEVQPPIFILSGTDPLQRGDIYDLVRFAASYNLHTILAAHATPKLDRPAIFDLKKSGLSRIAMAVDGSRPDLHDRVRGVDGSFARTINAIRWANEAGIPLQINTCVTKSNLRDLANIVALLRGFRLVLWNIAFPVPRLGIEPGALPTAEQFEQSFAWLYRFAQEMPFKIQTNEAQHYRRYVLQQRSKKRQKSMLATPALAERGIPGLRPVNEGRGVMFISHTGEVCPGSALPVSAGNVRTGRLETIYRDSDLFASVRDSTKLRGKCSHCEFREICGGSRARSYALTGDIFAADPCCSYIPRSLAGTHDRKSPAEVAYTT